MKLNVARIGPVIAVVLLLVITSAAFLSDRSRKEKTTDQTQARSTEMTFPAKPSNANTPKKEKNSAPVLTSLVAGLEAKVTSDPNNLNNQLLLAQTYGEIGRLQEGIELTQKLRKQFPEKQHVDLIMATLLGKKNDSESLNEALGLLSKMENKPSPEWSAAKYHKGLILVKMNKKDSAINEWKTALSQLSQSDPYYKSIEKVLRKQNADSGR